MSRGGHIFVSYAHADADYVRRLVAFLRDQGVAAWGDELIPTGSRWDEVLKDKIDTCRAVVVVMSAAARGSYWVGVELDHARTLGRAILPLLLDGEPLFGLGIVQHESVRGGRMPSPRFVEQLIKLDSLDSLDSPVPGARRPAEAGVGLRQVGVVPNSADCFQHRPFAEDLDRALAERGSAIETQILSGLGGVGKTQLAVAVVRQLIARSAIDDLVWVTSADPDAITSTLARAGVQFAGAPDNDPALAARLFQSWLATTNRRWLVVFDDLADPRHLDGWWPPPSRTGRVLVTTRRRDAALDGHGRMVEVDLFTNAQARAYLADKFAKHPGRLIQADQLAADLGYLPVALGQAAAYIADRDIDCAEYRRRFAAQPLTQLAPDARPDDYRRSVAVTLSLAVDAANELAPAGLAMPLLLVLSLLDPNGIPRQIVTTSAVIDYLTNQLGVPVGGDQARDALTCLTRLNLADTATDPSSGVQIQVHALVQRATRDQAPPDLVAVAATTTADALVQLWAKAERDTSLTQQLRANTVALRIQAEDHCWTPDAHPLLFLAGQSLGRAGLVKAAQNHFDQLTAEAATRLGPDHRDTLTARNNYAWWRGEAGDPAGAAAAFDALLTDRLRVLGPDHADTLTTRSNLATRRGEAGDPAAATVLKALLIDLLRVLGPNHPETLTARSRLASWRGRAGDAAGAAIACEVLLTDRLRLLGPDHLDTLTTRSNLASWRGRAGDSAGAAAAFEALLNDRLRILGPDHPDTLRTRSNLASWRGEAGDPSGAAAAFEALLNDRLRILGPDHPATMRTRSNIASWRGASDPAGAATAFEALLNDRLRILGPDHPDTLTTRHNLARWRGEAGDSAGAAAALEALLTDQLRVLGPDHPDTLTTRRNLAHWQSGGVQPNAT